MRSSKLRTKSSKLVCLMLYLMGLTLNNSFFYESDILLHFCSGGWIGGGGGAGGGGEGHLRGLKGGGVNGLRQSPTRGEGGVKNV